MTCEPTEILDVKNAHSGESTSCTKRFTTGIRVSFSWTHYDFFMAKKGKEIIITRAKNENAGRLASSWNDWMWFGVWVYDSLQVFFAICFSWKWTFSLNSVETREHFETQELDTDFRLSRLPRPLLA